MTTGHELTGANTTSINTTANAVVATNINSTDNNGSIYTADQLNGISEEKENALNKPSTIEAIISKLFTAAQLASWDADKINFLTDQDTIQAIRDANYDVNKLGEFELPKIKALVSYSSIKAINNKIYKAEQLFACEVKKIKLLTSESITKVVTTKVYTAEQLLSCDFEKIQVLTSAHVLNAIKSSYYTAKQLLECTIEKIQVLTSDAVTASIQGKVFTAEQLLACESDKIKALASEEAIETIRQEKGKVDAVKDMVGAYAEKLKAWKEGTTTTKPDNEFKDVGLYTAKELLACDTNKILALTDEVSQALIVNKIYSIEQMLKFDVAQLEAFIAKARGYENPESAVADLGKVYFFALNGMSLPLRELLEKEKASANNNDNLESPLAVTVHAGFGPNAHLLVEHKGHFNHHDFVMDANYVQELIGYIPNILSKQEQQMAFTGFTKHTEVSNCVTIFEDWCLVELALAVTPHDEL